MIVVLLAVFGAAADIFVSPSGNDASGTGSAAAPFQSVSRARDELRSRGEAGRCGSIVLLPGTFRVSGPLIFNSSDSGLPGCPKKIVGMPGATVSGGVDVAHLFQPAGDFFVADVSHLANSSAWPFEELTGA